MLVFVFFNKMDLVCDSNVFAIKKSMLQRKNTKLKDEKKAGGMIEFKAKIIIVFDNSSMRVSTFRIIITLHVHNPGTLVRLLPYKTMCRKETRGLMFQHLLMHIVYVCCIGNYANR